MNRKVTYCISDEARGALRVLATAQSRTLSKTVELLILAAKKKTKT